MTQQAVVSSTIHGLVLQPDWLVPIDSPAIFEGFLVASAGTIEHLGAELPERFHALPRIRLEKTAILPGWINSHCHLEFSDLVEPISALGSFDGWLSRVIQQRALVSSPSAEQRLEQRRHAIRQGLIESWKHGVRWIVDNVTAPWDPAWISHLQSEMRSEISTLAASLLVPDALISVQPCFELIDVREERWHQTHNFAFEQIDAPKWQGVCSPSLAPHAPYTASTHVTRCAADWSSENRGLVSMHLAESREELQWLDHRTGSLGAWIETKIDANHRSNIGTIDEHLRLLASAWRSLVVHGNFLTKHQVDWLHEHCERMAVVYCPRTHAWFHHPPYPLSELKSQGIPVLLGTDSRASNPDLNLWEEVKEIASRRAEFEPSDLARMITSNASRFLDIPRKIGRMELGGASQLTAMRWNQSDGADAALRTENELWRWMVQSGVPYPLEMDDRFALATHRN
jgi:cytosine/adenosine deaminase-related metal-dependent hydrolase